jgi:FG-GAP repeat/Dockerin type I domain
MKTALVLIIVFALGFLITPVSEISAQCPATYTYEGAAAYDDYGQVTAIIGDYNNDGFDDFAIGDSENDESHTRAGKVDVYSGYDGSLMFTILGEDSFDRFGISISGGEDVDGDGIDDILIGAHWWGSALDAYGRVYIFFGEASPSNTDASAADVIIEGTAIDTDFGVSVCMTDNHLLIGAPRSDADAGKVFIFQHSGLTTPGLYDDTDAYTIFTGETAGDYFGIGLAGIKRNEYWPDFIFIGAMYNDDGGNDAGKVYEQVEINPGIYPASSIDYTITGEAPNGRFGQSISGAGFLNDNTGEDIIIGAPTYSRAYIFYSVQTSGDLAEDADIILNGTGGSDWFGLSVSSAGDFNFDGIGDVVVGAQLHNAGAGKMYVFSGDDGTELFSVEGEAAGDRFGYSVAGGDISGDGLGDIIVGAPDHTGTAGASCGKAYVYQGLSEARFCNLVGEVEGDYFGRSVSGAGDVNKDGYPDFIVGASSYDNNVGRAYVYSGLDGSILHTFSGESVGDNLGESVAGAGDVNKDGYADLIVGVYGYDALGTYVGRAYVYSGQNGSTLHTFDGENEWDQLGYSVSGAGDVNNDGYDDLIVGAAGHNSDAGRAYVYSGQNGDILHTFDGAAEWSFLGGSVSGAGDVDKDGYADLIVGVEGYPGLFESTGRAYVYSGQNGSILHTFDGEHQNSNFGNSVSDAGDVNNDGYPDLIVGARTYKLGGTVSAAGRAYVFSGEDGSTLHTFDAENEYDNFGGAVSGAGDIDDDCHDDLIVGAPYENDYVKIFSGQDGSLMYRMSGSGHYGGSVSGIGDVNNDGRTAVIVGNSWEDLAYVYVLGTEEVCLSYICGDANTDLTVNVSDAVWIINYVFVGGDPPDPLDSGDANCDGTSNVSDAVWIINYVFVGGNEPCDSDGDSIPDC